MILLDTHIWFYYMNDGIETLSPNIRSAIKNSGTLGIHIISCWEIAMLISKGRIKLPMDATDWISAALSYKGFKLIELSPEVAVLSTQLPGGFHKDPADRMLAATCLKHNLPLCTYDEKIIEWGYIKTIS